MASVVAKLGFTRYKANYCIFSIPQIVSIGISFSVWGPSPFQDPWEMHKGVPTSLNFLKCQENP